MEDDQLREGDVFAGYLVEGVLGRGGMGTVYEAAETALHRKIALKIISGGLSSDADFVARFRREARLAASVEHPNVVPVFATGSESGRLYLAMKLIGGSDLARILKSGPLEREAVIRVLRRVGAALDAAHAAGLVHRDVKPANILIEDANLDAVYLTDFGISKVVEGEGADATLATGLTGRGQILGTAGYVAPELIEEGTTTSQSDIYSLACVAFEALTGSQPFARGSEVATLVAHTKAPRPRASDINPSVPPSADRVLQRGMAMDPANRPTSAAAFVNELNEAFDHPRGRGRRRAAGALALSLLVVTAVVVLLSVRSEDGAQKQSSSQQPSPERPTPRVTVAGVEAGPVGLVAGGGQLWVASRDADMMQRFSASAIKAGPETSVEIREPRSLAAGFGAIWAVNHQALFGIDVSRANASPTEIKVGSQPDDVAVDGESVWVTNEGDATLSKVDPSTRQETVRTQVPPTPRSVATGAGSVWVASDAGELTKVDAGSGSVVDSVPVGIRPTSAAFGHGSVWVSDNADGALYRIEPGEASADIGAVDRVARTAASPRGVAAGIGGVWVASGAENLLEEFSYSGQRIGDPIDIGNDPADVALGDGAVFTANFGNSTVSRVDP